ncbi:MAG: MBL fold metallo-hydrolase [Chloroflexi bacterium]|nr:MBL fold metallo-hydrolase [Chloroflexota bacterium]
MPNYFCVTCGAQFAETPAPPDRCPICDDERQYVGSKGRQWITPEALKAAHHNIVREEEPGLTGIGAEPDFAISQRALLVQATTGNVLWDCTSLIDEAAVQAVRERGGLSAIAISHPHFYTGMVEWSRAFGGVPINLHADNREWVMRPDPAIVFWEGETHALADGLTLIRCGGHFPGSTVLHWGAGSNGKGALLTGDTLMVVPDRRYVSFMYSYPNLIPLGATAIRRILKAIEPFPYDRIYSAWFGRVLAADARAAVARSAERYFRAIES